MACLHKHGVYDGMDGYVGFVYSEECAEDRECGKEVEWFDYCPDCGVKLSEVEFPKERVW